MRSNEIEFIDLTNKQYEALIETQMETYKKILDFCKENINDLEKIKIIDNKILEIEEKTLTELEKIRVYNKIFIESIK
ncbi:MULTISPECIES: hypothetical protein [unclassified Clostridium]|uniref:hypothetical protein n=1 Tax=unclassified Clostridium TaxID=2614128 RepID=UPI00023AFE0C|nr:MULTISPECIES: hypothetical protein [unclassified Clostridium]EHI99638.1 hypothetical protein CDLVIII_3054 [Clostridium sp. DL-VIII]OOM80126.1 hypothetical protein CLOBL_11740 [Clostridium sp. BL-8]